MARNSNIMLCKNIKLDKNYQNCLTYTETQMFNLCNTNKVVYANDFSFIREEENAIIVPFSYANCITCNYMAFQNPRYSNKWFFAFIDSIEYVSDGACRVNFTVDVFATWYDYWTAKTCFVIREHVNDDTFGLHTVPEGLDTGEYIHAYSSVIYNASTTYICVGVSEVIDEIDANPFNTQYNGIYSGIKYILCETPLAATKLIMIYDKKGKGDAVSSIFLIPTGLVGTVTFTTITAEGLTTQIAVVPNSTTPVLLATSPSYAIPSTIGTYIPVNKKIFTYPYCFFYISNNIGNDVIYHYEDFIDNTAQFKVFGAITPGGSIKAVPLNYKKLPETTSATSVFSFNYGVMGAKLPMCSWTTDPYTNWLTQNGVNIAGVELNAKEASIAGGIGAMLAGGIMMATGVGSMIGGGLMATGAAGIFNSMQSNYQKDMTPPQAKGSLSGGDIQYSLGKADFQMFRMTIREEFARSIDAYFTRFGYKVNSLKLPNQTGRTYFNYVEIGKSEIIGYPNTKGCPADAMEQINNIYRNGVTLWHDHSRIGNFEGNTIVTPTATTTPATTPTTTPATTPASTP